MTKPYEAFQDISFKKPKGYHANSMDKYITGMASRKIIKTEKTHDFFVDLSRMAEMAFSGEDDKWEKQILDRIL